MAGLQLTGLASGLDWKSLVDQLMAVEHAPADRLATEQTRNSQMNSALSDIGTKLTALQTAVAGLQDGTLFTGRAASLSGTGWSAIASAGATTGTYEINVTQLASVARRDGTPDIGSPLSATNDVSALTIATMPLATTITAGTFSVNGRKITVATTDSLQDVFDAINTATGGEVTASYDSSTDKITFSGSGEISLGAANDTSNFLRAFKLGNNGTDTVTSSAALGSTRLTGSLASAGLRTAITAVDADGNGTFQINGVDIAYNVNSDSIGGIITRINSAGAGVTAGYDAINDRVVLKNSTAGDLGLSISEDAGGLLGALGISGGTFVRGQNTEYTINGGSTLTATGTTLDASSHGITGLSVSANSEGTQTVTVSSDTATMKDKIDAFITAYNTLQKAIEDKTKITSSNGKVTAAVLASNREVQAWASNLRGLAFQSISGTIGRLETLGIDFKSGSNELEIKDETKLDTALRDRPAEVESFFQTSGTGLAAKFASRLDTLISQNSDQQDRLTKANTDLDRQIADIERRLEQQRALLEASFIAMESAQAKIQQQSTALTNAFSSTSTGK